MYQRPCMSQNIIFSHFVKVIQSYVRKNQMQQRQEQYELKLEFLRIILAVDQNHDISQN